MAATVVDELVTKFSFQGSIDPLLDHNAALGKSIGLFGAAYAATTAAAAAFAAWADSVLTGVDAQAALARETGVAIAAMQELSYVAGQTQSSGDALASSLSGLATLIGKAAWEGSEELARLGVSVYGTNGQLKTADQLLLDIGSSFRALGLSTQQQRTFAQSLGIDPSLLTLMGKTRAEMAAMRDRARELGTLTDEQAEAATRYKAATNELWYGLDSMRQLVAVGVAPEMERLAGQFTELLIANKGWIVDGIAKAVEFGGELLAMFNRLAPVVAGIGAAFLTVKWVPGLFAAMTGPIGLTVAAIGGVLLAVDDLIVAFDGGKSVIADFFEETWGIDLVATLKNVAAAAKEMFTALADAITSAWQPVSDLLDPVINLHKTAVGYLWAGVKDAAGGALNNTINQSNSIVVYANDAQAAGDAVVDGLSRQINDARTQMQPRGR